MCFQGVRSLGLFGAILGHAGVKIRKGGGGKVTAIPTWAAEDNNQAFSIEIDESAHRSPLCLRKRQLGRATGRAWRTKVSRFENDYLEW